MRIEFELTEEYAAKMRAVLAENHAEGGDATPSEIAAGFVAAILDEDHAAHTQRKH